MPQSIQLRIRCKCSIWESLAAAKQMETLAPMLAQRPILEMAGVEFDPIANYEPAWNIRGTWTFHQQGSNSDSAQSQSH